MGAWSGDAFGNDTACDWAYGLKKAKDFKLLTKTLYAVLDDEEEILDSDMASEGIAACEVIARLKGNWGLRNAYTAEVDRWVEAQKKPPTDELVKLALSVLERVQTPPSELLDLWSESDDSEWRDALKDLENRLR